MKKYRINCIVHLVDKVALQFHQIGGVVDFFLADLICLNVANDSSISFESLLGPCVLPSWKRTMSEHNT